MTSSWRKGISLGAGIKSSSFREWVLGSLTVEFFYPPAHRLPVFYPLCLESLPSVPFPALLGKPPHGSFRPQQNRLFHMVHR